jgi:hypothetical protein
MVGQKNYNKGFYPEFINTWLEINPNNKPLKVTGIINLFKKEKDLDFIQSKIYKTLVALNQQKLSNYDNLNWNLNLKNLLLTFESKRNSLNKSLEVLQNDILEDIKDLKELENNITSKL